MRKFHSLDLAYFFLADTLILLTEALASQEGLYIGCQARSLSNREEMVGSGEAKSFAVTL